MGIKHGNHLIVETAKKYLEEHFMRSITLAEVADHVHVSPNYLSFLFKEITGKNFSYLLTSFRMQKALQLLQDPQFKVYEIGQMVGYANSGYFSEIFKKFIGKSPVDFRQNR